MIINIEQNVLQKDIEISIKYPVKNKIIERILSLIKSVDTQIECYSDDIVKLVNVSDIYYIESVDGKTIVCCEKENYLVKNRLYQIYEKLRDNGFIQISKYCILNINKLDRFKPLDNNRLEAVLSNGVYLCITRKYISGIKQILREKNK
ncbi:MAG: LytTR family transcriptional regulator DNA-binding domain-containing protein [Spirochaetes bacterium]|nr:LytTR family transcriptional regulator DNA-binding domain-containing protein [Brevinematales bacterium]MCL1959105.1 LytTR family transcriptional regulator DNA-binding domain-containing protein [Spirochaetota bacterium]